MVFKRANSSLENLKPNENTPLLGHPGHDQPQSCTSKTLANVFIAVVGSGVLGLPYAFKRTGWLMGLLMLSCAASMTYYCMMLLVASRRKVESLNNGFSKIASFGDLGYVVCGTSGRFIVDVMIILSQAGFCVSYLIFIANTLANLYNNKNGVVNNDLYMMMSSNVLGLAAKTLYIWGCFPFQMGLNSIKTLTHMAPLSIFADVVDLGAMGVVMAEDVGILLEKRPEVQAFGGLSVFFYGMGVAVYAFEGIGMVLPLESEAKDKEKFGKVLAIAMIFITIMYAGFGLLGYLAFGQDTRDIITANLRSGMISTLVQLGLCINLFFTFPLMMHPVYEIMERRFWNGRYCLWMRWLLVLVVSLVALYVPNFADFLSLVGSSVCCTLGFVLPAVFHSLVFKEEIGWTGWILDMGIAVSGIILGVSGTWYALAEIFAIKE